MCEGFVLLCPRAYIEGCSRSGDVIHRLLLVSYGCCKKLMPTWWLKARAFISYSSGGKKSEIGFSGSKSSCQQGHASLWRLEGGTRFLAFLFQTCDPWLRPSSIFTASSSASSALSLHGVHTAFSSVSDLLSAPLS